MINDLKTGMETVICGIPPGRALQVVNALKLGDLGSPVHIEMHLPSMQDRIVIEEFELTKDEAQKIALFAPNATITIEIEGKIAKSFGVTFPEVVEKILPCPSVGCITNHESVATYFYVFQYRNQTKLRCRFCEKSFHLE